MNREEKIAKKLEAGTLHSLGRSVEYDLSFSDRKGAGGIFINSVNTVGYDGRTWWWIPQSGHRAAYLDESKFRYALGQELMSSLKAGRIMEILRNNLAESEQKVASKKVADDSFDLHRVKQLLEFELGVKLGAKLLSFRGTFSSGSRYEGEAKIRLGKAVMFAQVWVESDLRGSGFENYEISIPSFRVTPNGVIIGQ